MESGPQGVEGPYSVNGMAAPMVVQAKTPLENSVFRSSRVIFLHAVQQIFCDIPYVIIEVGANVIVAGSAIFHGDTADNCRRYVDILNNTVPGEVL